MSVRGAFRWIGATSIALLAGQCALTASPAGALTGYPNSPQVVFGATGSGNGQFSQPAGVAVDDSSGDVYVVDVGDLRVEKFDAEGKYISQIDGAGTPGGSFFPMPGGIAVDNSSDSAKGDVYVAADTNGIDVFDSSGKYLSQITGNFTDGLQGLAVDGSGNIWGDSLGPEEGTHVEELSDTGTSLGEFNTTAGSSSRTNVGLAVDSGTYVYAMGECQRGYNFCLGKYNSSGAKQAEFGVGTAAAVNEATHDVFIGGPSGVEQSGPFGEPYGSPVQTFGSGGVSSPGGIAVNDATGAVYVTNSAANTVAVFEQEQLPSVTTGGNEPVKGGATLNGVVNPEGNEVTGCQFEYGTSTSYGHASPCAPAPGTGTSPVAVTAQLTGLESETTYHYRLVAANANGELVGSDKTFTTPPSVLLVNEQASEIQGTSVTLNALFIQGGFDTHDWFEYGFTNAYGSQTPHIDSGPGVEEEIEAASAHVTGLEPNTTYHFRFVAENEFGVSRAEDGTFKTLTLLPSIALPAVSAITRTTAVISGGINPEKSPTSFQVVYGETGSYGEHTASFAIGAAFAEQTIKVGLEGLAPGRTYHYTVAATNEAGTARGPDQTFTTAAATSPTAITGDVSNIALTTATLSGTIDAQGLETSYEFDLGTDTSYGTSFYGEAGSSAESIELSIGLEDLAPATTYHYRIVAINSDGRIDGEDRTFTTPAYFVPIVLPSSLALVQAPQIAFPTQAGVTVPATKKLTNAQKLKRALQACKRESKRRRASCQRTARARYGAKPKSGKGRKK